MRDYQRQGKWPGHLGGFRLGDPTKGTFTSLKGANVLIWDMGNIGRQLSPHVRDLGAKIRGVILYEETVDGIQGETNAALPKLLPQTDALIMILPGSKATKHAQHTERLALLPNHAWAINVGRELCVDENTLGDAFNTGAIGGAALDVLHVKLLPESSPLWNVPNIIISPHAAGGRPRYSETLTAENLRRFQAGQPLKSDLAPGGMYASPSSKEQPKLQASL